jgi:lysocardiolipin and lysophospholipid acyltransferase
MTILGLSRPFKMLLKQDLKKIPIFGWAMQLFMFCFLDRYNRPSDLLEIQTKLRYHVRNSTNTNFLIFPEGTDLSVSNIKKSNQCTFLVCVTSMGRVYSYD